MSWPGAAATVAARELLALARSPAAWVVGAAFLVLEGTSFSATVRALADPTRPGDYGAVLRGQFAGSLLGWVVVFAVVAAVTMRLVAEERRQGTWETLVTAPVAESAITAGKWLAAWLFLTLLWLPTAVYPLIVAGFAPAGVALDLGPILAAYLGVAAHLMALAALGLLASALVGNQVVASVLCTAGCIALLLAGELDEVAPAWLADAPTLARAVAWIDLRAHMDGFARGDVALGPLVYLVGLAALLGAFAHAAAGQGRAGAGRVGRRAAVAGLIALDVVLANLLAARHPVAWDWSADQVNRLDDATAELLAEIDRPLIVTVVRPALAGFDPVHGEVDRLIERARAAQPRIERRDVDPVRDPATSEAIAARFGAPPRDLAEGGAVVLELGVRARVVELLDMAAFHRDALDVGAIESLAVERAIAGALAELVRGRPPHLCLTSGHGEVELLLAGPAPEIVPPGPPPTRCQVIVVAGPREPLSADEALALDAHLGRGGGLLVLTRELELSPALSPTGLEAVLAARGLAPGDAVVVDPAQAIDGRSFAVAEGYADHPVTRAFQGRRVTVWRSPRAVAVSGRAVALVRASDEGWAERDLADLAAGRAPRRSADDGALTTVAGAAADRGRVALLGSASSFAAELAEGAPANRELIRRLVDWLGGIESTVPVPDKTPEHLRLVMTGRQLALVTGATVVGLPLVLLAIGVAVAIRRRRG